ncbi:AT-rich interactive domain-containing protein 2 [Acorus calamus]|uniref:AT-rich interactive domain-containing protein 2 n=1 Tax=Acorus calamus TaxID=4465 RepID=A0AAV9EVZ7_ACOCL|nr:AT-rich interactive domain-containing protein 2 [Acorus calamus]
MVLKHNKRSFDDDEVYQLSHKHQRQVDYMGHLASFDEIFPFGEILGKPNISGEESFHVSQDEDRLVNISGSELPLAAAEKVFENDTPCVGLEDPNPNFPVTLSSFSWATCNTSQEDVRLERLIFSPDQWDPIDSPHRKLVPIGPDHQAEVPEWVPCGARVTDGVTDKFLGTCVLPMSDSDSKDWMVGQGRTECNCLDESSIRCVRQRVSEARGDMMKTLGLERFGLLGFLDMGEGVSERWTEEEERVFHGVVFSNPASIGKNFWDYLVQVFPSRSYTELVSYYFNVFMLRKRAGQNRVVPLNTDSDNDEWQEGDRFEFSVSEEGEEDNSVVESTPDLLNDVYGRDSDHSIDDGGECEDDECVVYNVSKDEGKDNLPDGAGDDSCTSYEVQHQDSNDDDHKSPHDEDFGINVWDVGYMSRSKEDPDFLPTYNVIEEVFGKEALDNHHHKGW